MDTELWHRFAKYGFKYERLDHFVWALRLHSLAKTSAHNFTVNHPSLALINNEAEQIRLLYFPDFKNTISFLFCRFFNKLKNRAKIKSIVYTMSRKINMLL